MAGQQGRGNKFSKVKYEEKVREVINTALRREFADPRLINISVTKVELTIDYSHAKVYWDTFDSGKRGDCKEALEATAGRMRKLLSTKMEVKHTPEIHYLYDSQYEDENKITKLLNDSADDE